MDRLEHRCAVSLDLTLERFLAPAPRAVMLGSRPALVLELREVQGRKVLRHALSVGLFRRSWDAVVLSEDAFTLYAEGGEGFATFRHEISLKDGELCSHLEWEDSSLTEPLSQARVAVPLDVQASPAQDARPTRRIVLGAKSAAA